MKQVGTEGALSSSVFWRELASFVIGGKLGVVASTFAFVRGTDDVSGSLVISAGVCKCHGGA